jgi:hypothetical protein
MRMHSAGHISLTGKLPRQIRYAPPKARLVLRGLG